MPNWLHAQLAYYSLFAEIKTRISGEKDIHSHRHGSKLHALDNNYHVIRRSLTRTVNVIL